VPVYVSETGRMWDVTYNFGSKTWEQGAGSGSLRCSTASGLQRRVPLPAPRSRWAGLRAVVRFQGLLAGSGDSKFTLRAGL